MRGSSNVQATSLPNANVGSKKSKEKPTIIDEDGMERTISKSEERLRQKDLKKAVEEKMRKGAIVAPPVSTGLMDARQKSLEREKKKTSSKEREARRQSMRQGVQMQKCVEPAVNKVAPVAGKVKAKENTKAKIDVSLTPDVKAEKPGLRKRLSRMILMGGGGPKSAKSERKGFGKIEEYTGP